MTTNDPLSDEKALELRKHVAMFLRSEHQSSNETRARIGRNLVEQLADENAALRARVDELHLAEVLRLQKQCDDLQARVEALTSDGLAHGLLGFTELHALKAEIASLIKQ